MNLDQRVKLDSTLGSLEGGPGENSQTQIDGRGIQGVNRCVEVQAKFGVGVQRASDVDESTGEIGVDSPIAPFVGIGQRGASDGSSEAAVIELGALRPQTDFDVAKTLAIGQLGKSHGQKLIPTRESAHTRLPSYLLNAATKFVVREKLHDLSKYGLSLVHTDPPRAWTSEETRP